MDRLVFVGTPRFGEVVLGALIGRYEIAAVVTQPDRKAGRGRRVAVSPVKALALAQGIPVLQPESLRRAEALEQVRQLAPLAIVVAAFGQLLPPAVLAMPPRGCVNVHASLLPRFRGAAPIPAAILSGDKETGVTIMLMDEGLDTGPILSQAAVPIEADDTTGSLTEKLATLGGQLLVETLAPWLRGDIQPRRQDESQATYAGSLRRQDGRIDWHEPAALIARRCRAFSPWPGAFTYWEGRELKVLRARAWEGEAAMAAPGHVVQEDEAGIAVATGNGLLVLRELQLAGRRPLPASDFARGQRGFVGSLLE